MGRDRDLCWRQGLRLGKPQDFSDLAHGRTGTGHRHLSSMDFIEGQGAVSDELTSVLLAISEAGRPLRVKRAAKTCETRGQFRRIQVANSREIRWRKPVKSAIVDHSAAHGSAHAAQPSLPQTLHPRGRRHGLLRYSCRPNRRPPE
jgi:hypothetical protein